MNLSLKAPTSPTVLPSSKIVHGASDTYFVTSLPAPRYPCQRPAWPLTSSALSLISRTVRSLYPCFSSVSASFLSLFSSFRKDAQAQHCKQTWQGGLDFQSHHKHWWLSWTLENTPLFWHVITVQSRRIRRNTPFIAITAVPSVCVYFSCSLQLWFSPLFQFNCIS